MIGKKYYSNNVYRYYRTSDIRKLEELLYQKECYRPAQIPSFERVMTRKKFREYLPSYFEGNEEYRTLESQLGTEMELKKYHSALYFVMKEAYYYGFLQLSNVKTLFYRAMKDTMESYIADKNRERREALKNFQKFYDALDPKLSFGEVCQALTTEFMIQNAEDQVRAETLDKKSGDKDVYEHFKLALYEVIRNAFLKYLESDAWRFLKKPFNYTDKKITEEEFCEDWNVKLFSSLADEMEQRKELYGWYTAAHFLHQKQLNFLTGSIKNYLQFISDIDRRARSLGNRTDAKLDEKEKHYKNIIAVLEFVQNFAGKISNQPGDYFKETKNSEEYAEFLSKYVAFKDPAKSYKQSLIDFCNESVNRSTGVEKVGIYHDPDNQILNRNVVQAKMFGNSRVLGACMEPVTLSEIRQYYRNQTTLERIFKKQQEKEDYVNTDREQRLLRGFQCAKNRIELYDITEYTELIEIPKPPAMLGRTE